MTALVLALVAGAGVGLALGGLGGGSSVLAVPALTYLLGLSPADAITASLVIVTVTSVTALAGHTREGNVAWRTGLLFAGAGVVPAALTGMVAGHLPQAGLTVAFAMVASVAAVSMLRSARAQAVGEVRPVTAGAAGAGLGAVTGLLGVGGGFLAVPALVRVLSLPVRRALGTSLLVITVNSLATLAARAGTAADLDWAVLAPFTAAAILGARDGRRHAKRLTGDTLQRIFAYVLPVVAALMLVNVFV